MPISRCDTATLETAMRSASSCCVQPINDRRRPIRCPSVSVGYGFKGASSGAMRQPLGLSLPHHLKVSLDHALDQRREVDRWLPYERLTGLGRVADEQIDLSRPHEAL